MRKIKVFFSELTKLGEDIGNESMLTVKRIFNPESASQPIR